MRDLLVYILIVLVYKVESRTFCDDQRCVCSDKGNSLQITCSSHPTVFEANYTLPNNVSILDLSMNNLTRVERSPSLDSKTLKQLLLVDNQIEDISVVALRLPSLQILDISHNQLEFIHRDTFALIKNLEYLNLANNKFSAFGNLNFYHLHKLKDIVLDNNVIGPSLEVHSLFEGGYDLTSEIQSISLRNVKLHCDNEAMFMNGTKALKKLTLAQNNITNIVELPHGLEYLDISNNPIKKISSTDFLFSIYLSELKLNNVLIKEVPDFAFFYLSSLQNLELAGNTHLKKFNSLAWGRIILKDQTDLFVENLTLRGANLTSLDSQMEGIFKKIGRVDLRDNPWRCDCGLSWLQNIQIPKEFADIRCSAPQLLFNRKILELTSAEFHCKKATLPPLPPLPPGDAVRTTVNIAVYCSLLVVTVVMMYFFIFSPKPFMYRQLPVEFPRTP